jgi:hypothetical protein
MLAPDGAEIRFASTGDTVEVTLSSPVGGCEVIAFWGEFQDLQRHAVGPERTTLRFTYPERLQRLRPGFCDDHAFPPHVWRLTVRGQNKHGRLHFHGMRGDGLRPPRPDEKPERTLLAYGTSVTDGFAASAMHLSFVAQAARRLRMDFVNLGSAGSAYCEPALADYIAARRDWHVATLGLSANMIGAGFSTDEFSERAAYMVNTVAGADPGRSVVCITVWPYFADLCDGTIGSHRREAAVAYREALRDVVRTSPHANVNLVEGAELLGEIGGYTVDLAHPGDFGMIRIGENLAARLAALPQGERSR